MQQRYRGAIASLLLAAGGLTACGGDDTQVDTTPQATTLDGAAIKGVVRNAAVEVIEVTTLEPLAGTRIGSGRTDDRGDFRSISIEGYNGGAVGIIVSGRPAGDPLGSTTVLCDVDLPGDNDCGPGVAFGSPVSVGPSFRLTSCLGSLSRGSSNRANATAFTSLLARRAQAFLSGQNNADAIRLATSEVNQLAGVNVVLTTPVDLTSPGAVAGASPEELTYTALSSGILRETNTGADAASNISGAIDGLAERFDGGSMSAADLQDLVDNARAQLESVGESDSTGTLAVLESIASSGEPYNPEPNPTVNATAVQQARALVASVRNEVQSVLELQAPGEAFGLQLDDVVGTDVTSGRLSAQLESAVLTIELVTSRFDAETKSGVLAPGQTRQGTIQTVDSGGQPHSAAFTVSRAADGTISGSIANQVVRNENVNVSFSVPNPDDVATPPSQFAASILGTVETTAAAGVRIAMNQGSAASAVVASENGGFNPETVGVVFDNGMVDLIGTIAEKGVDNPASFEGRIGVSILRCTREACNDNNPDRAQPHYNPTRILFEGIVANTGNRARARIEFAQTESSARNFDPGTDFNQNHVLRCFPDGQGGNFCFEEPDPNDDPGQQFQAAYTSTNFMDANLTVTAEAAFPNRPLALISLTIDSDGFVDPSASVPDGAPLASATLVLTRGSTEALRFTGANTRDAPLNPTLTIRNASGTQIVIRNFAQDDAPVEGEILVGSERAGTISGIRGGGVIVRYDDGTFETLFN